MLAWRWCYQCSRPPVAATTLPTGPKSREFRIKKTWHYPPMDPGSVNARSGHGGLVSSRRSSSFPAGTCEHVSGRLRTSELKSQPTPTEQKGMLRSWTAAGGKLLRDGWWLLSNAAKLKTNIRILGVISNFVSLFPSENLWFEDKRNIWHHRRWKTLEVFPDISCSCRSGCVWLWFILFYHHNCASTVAKATKQLCWSGRNPTLYVLKHVQRLVLLLKHQSNYANQS